MGESSQHVNFNRYSFFPTDNDENQSEERGRRCSALSMLSFSSMEESASFPATEDQRDINTFNDQSIKVEVKQSDHNLINNWKVMKFENKQMII